MARIVFAWELGGDYGHLSRLIPVALELARRGHEPVFVLRELVGAQKLLGPHGFRWYQAPLWLGRVNHLPDSLSYAEMLMRLGFLNAEALLGVCRAWRNLADLLTPDLLVLDHAPTALLATRGSDIARVNLGSGFFVPPAGRPMPAFRWWERSNLARLADSEERVRQVANEVLHALAAPPLLSLDELTRCEAELLCCFPELDHYLGRVGGEYVGPVFSLGQGVAPEWPEGEGKRIFAYLKPDYTGLEPVLTALRVSRCRVLLHIPGAARKTLQDHGSERMVFSPQPVDMESVRGQCDLAVTHGGIGTAAAMLLAGKPLLLLPTQTEQMMFAYRVGEQGMAALAATSNAATVARQLKRVLADKSIGDVVAGFARTHQGYDQRATIALIADRCEALLPRA